MDITKRARADSRMVFAWYGASAKGVESALTHGFGMPCEVANQEGPGVGVYLSHVRLPQNSAMLSETDENGEKHVVLCRVILGRCEKVHPGSEQSLPSSVEYDTGVDDLTNPKWYTVWHSNMNTQNSTRVCGELQACQSAWCGEWYVDYELDATCICHDCEVNCEAQKLNSSTQDSTVGTLCGMCKEGKLGKDVFMKQLRYVVGDDILRSTIQEIHG